MGVSNRATRCVIRMVHFCVVLRPQRFLLLKFGAFESNSFDVQRDTFLTVRAKSSCILHVSGEKQPGQGHRSPQGHGGFYTLVEIATLVQLLEYDHPDFWSNIP